MKQKFVTINPAELDSADSRSWLTLTIFQSLRYKGGITIGIDHYQPSTGYALSIFKATERKYTNIPDQSVINSFIADNIALLSLDNNFVGGWFDRENNVTYLDVSKVIQGRDEALNSAKLASQICIFDIVTKEYIYL